MNLGVFVYREKRGPLVRLSTEESWDPRRSRERSVNVFTLYQRALPNSRRHYVNSVRALEKQHGRALLSRALNLT